VASSSARAVLSRDFRHTSHLDSAPGRWGSGGSGEGLRSRRGSAREGSAPQVLENLLNDPGLGDKSHHPQRAPAAVANEGVDFTSSV
jgi:hypothetical protein